MLVTKGVLLEALIARTGASVCAFWREFSVSFFPPTSPGFVCDFALSLAPATRLCLVSSAVRLVCLPTRPDGRAALGVLQTGVLPLDVLPLMAVVAPLSPKETVVLR